MKETFKEGIRVYTPRNFEDIYELTRILHNVTNCVIVDCTSVRILPSHFISLAISRKNCVILVNTSISAINIFKTIGVEKDIHNFNTIDDAIHYIKNKV
jgi:hypothetical protein